MLDEEKDARTEDFLGSRCEYEREREKSGRGCGECGTESGSKESDKDENADNDSDGHDQTVESVDSLVNIVHARVDRLSLSGVISHSQDHLFQTDVAVSVSVNRSKTFLSLLLATWTHDFDEIFQVELVLAFHDHGHPDTPSQGFSTLVPLQSGQDDGMSRVGVKDFLAGDLGSDSTEN